MLDFKQPIRMVNHPTIKLDVRPNTRDSSNFEMRREDGRYLETPNGNFPTLWFSNEDYNNYGWPGEKAWETFFENFTSLDFNRPVRLIGSKELVRIVAHDGPNKNAPIVGFTNEGVHEWNTAGRIPWSITNEMNLEQAPEVIEEFFIIDEFGGATPAPLKSMKANLKVVITDGVLTHAEVINHE